jgi:hypothetical protein
VQSVPREHEPVYSLPGPPSSQSPSEAQTHVSVQALGFGTNHCPAVLSMAHKNVGLDVLPTYANSWSPRSLAWRMPPVKFRAWSTVPGGTSLPSPFVADRKVRWGSKWLRANGPVGESQLSSVT